MHPKYEEDFYGWLLAEAHLLRERRMDELDFENLIEEIESMGRSYKSALSSRLAQLFFHMLKWQHQPDFRGRSWRGTIEEQRLRIKELLEDNPSLTSKMDESITKAYRLSLALIKKETPLDLALFPSSCPYTLEQGLDDTFYPE